MVFCDSAYSSRFVSRSTERLIARHWESDGRMNFSIARSHITNIDAIITADMTVDHETVMIENSGFSSLGSYFQVFLPHVLKSFQEDKTI